MLVAEAKDTQTTKVRNVYLNEAPRAQVMMDFYDAVGDSVTKKLWSDYLTALKTDAKTLKDLVQSTTGYENIKDLQFQWTTAPDAEVIEEEVVPNGV
jgi:hypothetical protein